MRAGVSAIDYYHLQLYRCTVVDSEGISTCKEARQPFPLVTVHVCSVDFLNK